MRDDAPPDNPAELTRYIEERYHARHRTELPEIADLAARVEYVHQGTPKVPVGIASFLAKLIDDLEIHMKKEELILFPVIRRGADSGIGTPIAVLRLDHEDHRAEINMIMTLTDQFTAPEGACGS